MCESTVAMEEKTFLVYTGASEEYEPDEVDGRDIQEASRSIPETAQGFYFYTALSAEVEHEGVTRTLISEPFDESDQYLVDAQLIDKSNMGEFDDLSEHLRNHIMDGSVWIQTRLGRLIGYDDLYQLVSAE